MDGMWATIVLDMNTNQFFAGRDHIGIVPMYFGTTTQGTLFISSEMKTIHDQVDNVAQFPPGILNYQFRPFYHELTLGLKMV